MDFTSSYVVEECVVLRGTIAWCGIVVIDAHVDWAYCNAAYVEMRIGLCGEAYVEMLIGLIMTVRTLIMDVSADLRLEVERT